MWNAIVMSKLKSAILFYCFYNRVTGSPMMKKKLIDLTDWMPLKIANEKQLRWSFLIEWIEYYNNNKTKHKWVSMQNGIVLGKRNAVCDESLIILKRHNLFGYLRFQWFRKNAHIEWVAVKLHMHMFFFTIFMKKNLFKEIVGRLRPSMTFIFNLKKTNLIIWKKPKFEKWSRKKGHQRNKKMKLESKSSWIIVIMKRRRFGSIEKNVLDCLTLSPLE